MVVPRSTSWFSPLPVRSAARDVLARRPGPGHDAQLREEQWTVLDIERAAQFGRVDLGRAPVQPALALLVLRRCSLLPSLEPLLGAALEPRRRRRER